MHARNYKRRRSCHVLWKVQTHNPHDLKPCKFHHSIQHPWFNQAKVLDSWPDRIGINQTGLEPSINAQKFTNDLGIHFSSMTWVAWFAGPPKLQISLSYCPTRLLQSMDGRCRPCVLRLGSNEATPCKGNQERVGYKMATRPFLSDKMLKEAIINFICIHHLTTCQQLHQEQSVQGAGQQMVFHPGSVCRCRNKLPPPPLFSWSKGTTRNGYLNQTSLFGGFHKKWGYPQNG